MSLRPGSDIAFGAFLVGTEYPMSKLAARLADQKSRPKGSRCSIGVLFEGLDDIDKQALLNALESPMQATDIARALRDEGHDVQGPTLARHRRGDCTCDAG